MTVMASVGNGKDVKAPPIAPELPERNRAAVEYGLSQYQSLVAERDRLSQQVYDLTSTLAAHRVALDAHEARAADAESRVATASLIRDQAIADRCKYEALFISLYAQLRAFKIPAAPLVTEASPDQSDAEGALP